jgi:hypothetical protein
VQEQSLDDRQKGTKLNTGELKAFIQEKMTFLGQMQNEIVEEDKIDNWGYREFLIRKLFLASMPKETCYSSG